MALQKGRALSRGVDLHVIGERTLLVGLNDVIVRTRQYVTAAVFGNRACKWVLLQAHFMAE